MRGRQDSHGKGLCFTKFSISKLSGDLLVQEYGKYFGLKTCCLRAGCLTGETHAGVELHGFLSYLFKSAYYKKKYYIYGYGGKQVRDNLSSYDVSTIIWELFKKPSIPGEVFNIGGGRESNISVLEAIYKCEKITKKKINFKLVNFEISLAYCILKLCRQIFGKIVKSVR